MEEIYNEDGMCLSLRQRYVRTPVNTRTFIDVRPLELLVMPFLPERWQQG